MVEIIQSFVIIILATLVVHLYLKTKKKYDEEETIKILANPLIYNENIANSIRNAKKSVYIYFQMIRPSSENTYPSLINEAIKDRIKYGDVEIQILTAKEYDRIAGAFELKNILIDNNIYFSSKLRITDLRYTLIDKKKVIIGINKESELLSTKYNPSDTWLEINSLRLGEILEKNFLESIKESESYYDYLTQIVLKYTEGKKENIEIAATQLNITLQEVSAHFKDELKNLNTKPFSSIMTNQTFDVFLAHNNQDKPLIKILAEKLRKEGVSPWLDSEQIPPGRWFQDVIQNAVSKVKSAAIFIGENGLGKWQTLELRAFISQCVENDIPVIPVLLPNVTNIPDNLLFLKELNWVTFHNEDDSDAISKLIWGINS